MQLFFRGMCGRGVTPFSLGEEADPLDGDGGERVGLGDIPCAGGFWM